MYKAIITILLTLCTSMSALAYCPSRDEEITGYIQCQNNNWIVPEQWGFRSGKTLKESYLMDMKPKWEQTKAEWTNTYNPKPIASNWKNAVSDTKIYGDGYSYIHVPRKWLGSRNNFLP